MTQTMKAMVLREHGGPDVLSYEDVPRPEPGPREVRVAVRAVAMNHLDLWVRRGGPAFHIEYPHRLGSEIAGVVDALGPGVTELEAGEPVVVNPGLSCGACRACLSGVDNLCAQYRILGENTQGGYAEYVVVPRENIAPYPGDLSFPDAAASLLTFQTAWQMLVHKARVQPGETVLVHGAASGVGVAGIQVARRFGAEVIATAGSDEKLALARELGASVTINYREQDFRREVKALTEGRGVDVVFEHVGGQTMTESVKAARNGGRIVTCGATAGYKPEIDLRHVFFRQIEILGSTMGSKGDLLAVLEHVRAGALRPVVYDVLALADAATGHRLLEDRRAAGKVVLTP